MTHKTDYCGRRPSNDAAIALQELTDRHDSAPRRLVRRDSFVGALLDLTFERRATPIVVSWLYALALVVIGFGTLFGLLWVWEFAPEWAGACGSPSIICDVPDLRVLALFP